MSNTDNTTQFKTEISDKTNLIILPSTMAASIEADLEASMKKWLLEPVELHVLEFAPVISFSSTLYKVFARFRKTLKENKKHLHSIHVSPGITQQFKTDGVADIFSPSPSLLQAKASAGLASPKSKLDTTLLTPFIQGTLNALKTQVQLDVTCGKPFLKKDHPGNIEIAGVISLNSSDMPGSIALCFSKDVFLKIYEKMVGEKHTEISSEIQDAASELLNIVFGYAKTQLLERGIRLERAIPTVLVGQAIRLQMGDKGMAMVLPFESPIGAFHMEIVIA